ncbi:MAG: hypothetical protein A2X34_01565 [Elusimicrobia bacterium GWC2_51_8]|nr:MAG: hypothetical protein A2X33_09050 [Elusimicrobia bacterium GWA2_51_34]OGR65781.1 MAG: hypothetical protein A2X34_01565 [Elusimicrobia bacterium GWC2_51_8]OGR85906.1 MAG: hypothetical protein A2021_05240 [Elusimicrobia bacterium GWF2_52_66]HAF95224.1 hypothetical protein [Elusimicrobiota bacterium]HCE97152.1 hypothetical protein [Elusimicrobiota bacterium]
MKPKENQSGKGFFPVLLFLVLLFTWTATSPCLKNGFINWDETKYIIRNPKIKTLSLESVKTIFSTSDLTMYSPLSTLSYALEYHVAGLNPKIYHMTSLLLHLFNTALVMVLAQLLLNGVWTVFFIALLFGIHPAHVESVAWAAERKDVLYAFFYLSSLIAYALRLNGAKTYLLSLAFFICALLAKPMAITLPIALLLIDYLKSGQTELRQQMNKIPFFILAVIFAATLLHSSSDTLVMSGWKRLITPLYNLGFYIYTLIWPFNLSAMYVSVPGGKPVFYAFAAGTLTGIGLLWKYFRHDKEIFFGASFFIIMLLPVLQFFPFGPVISADRYTYLSSIGVFIIGAVCARRIWRRLSPAFRNIAIICAIGAVLTLTVTARVRCAAWKDGVSLWNDTLQKQPLAASALLNLCGAYIQANMNNEAELCLSEAIRLYPKNDNNYYNLGFLSVRNKEFGKAEEYFVQTLSISPCHTPALNNMGNIYLLKGETTKAAQYYTKATECDDAYSAAYLNLGKLALSRKDTSKAIFFYEKALLSDPSDKETRTRLKTLRKI